MIVSFMSNDSSIYTLALKNVVAVLSFVLVIDGLSLVDFSLREKVQKRLFKVWDIFADSYFWDISLSQ